MNAPTPPGRPRFLAFIDEAGDRGQSAKSSHHFVMSAVVLPEENMPQVSANLASLRSDLGRNAGDTLHFRNLRAHALKLYAVEAATQIPGITICTVVVCKRHLTGKLDNDQAYLYTFRFLLERLSWLSRDRGRDLNYTLAHIVRFKLETLREYERILRGMPDWECKIAWSNVPTGGRLDQPSREENLQLADLAASATFAAFEPAATSGTTDVRYLKALSPVMYRRGTGPNALTSYGLKMHPSMATTQGIYPWVATL